MNLHRNRNLDKNYSPDSIEQKWYSKWIENGLFNAEINPQAKAFSIVIPPPNITGSLHVGHAFDHTFQDIMCRSKRMQGYEVLWLPGTDHAGIATQNVVEKDLAKQGISRYDLGRDEFVKKVWDWKKIYGSRIIEQMKRLGNSCDWRRERFTLDEGLSKAVRTVFVRLYKKGLIYKGKYIVNWCPRCSTAISDLEVEYEESQGNFYYVKYPVVESGKLVNDFVLYLVNRHAFSPLVQKNGAEAPSWFILHILQSPSGACLPCEPMWRAWRRLQSGYGVSVPSSKSSGNPTATACSRDGHSSR